MSRSARFKNIADLISSIAVTLAAGALVWSVVFREPAASPVSGRHEEAVKNVAGLQIGSGQIRHQLGVGSIAIIEFADFQCPFCRRHAVDTLPAIKQELIRSGKARYIAFHFPIGEIHPHATVAAAAAECAGRQQRYWEMHETLFANYEALADVDVLGYARKLKLDQPAFEACLESSEVQDRIRTDQAEGKRLGVTGTPAFFIGRVQSDGSVMLLRRITGAAPVSVFRQEVEMPTPREASKPRSLLPRESTVTEVVTHVYD